jgi:hypothetical protein
MFRKISGVIIPTAPVVHGDPGAKKGDDRNSNHTPGRRIPVFLHCQSGGKSTVKHGYRDVNVVSGNGIRGLGRRLFARFTLETLGVAPGELPKEVVMLLFVGGATGAKYKLDKIAEKTILEVRQNLPFIDLLGGTIHGHFISGVLKVGFAVPYLKETAWMNTSPYKLDNPPTYTEFESQVTRKVEYAQHHPEIVFDEETDDGREARMIYTAEVIPAGTHLLHTYTAVPLSENTALAMDAFIALLCSAGYMGGWSRAGHGAFIAHYYDESTGEEYRPSVKPYADFLKSNADKIIRELKELPKKFPAMLKENNGNGSRGSNDANENDKESAGSGDE